MKLKKRIEETKQQLGIAEKDCSNVDQIVAKLKMKGKRKDAKMKATSLIAKKK